MLTILKYLFFILAVFVVFGAPLPAAQLHINQRADGYTVSLVENGQTLLSSPPEGLWSIALDWQNKWPADWRHAKATKYEQIGGWHVLSGDLKTAGGVWRITDSYSQDGDLVKCVRRLSGMEKIN